MTKARRMMQENISLIDLIIELVDARIPYSSRNPDLEELGKGKARLVLLNKSDLSDPNINTLWSDYFKEKGILTAEVNSKTKKGISHIRPRIMEACAEKIERNKKRGILNRPLRTMVVGIPNVGKSTLINTYSGKSAAKTGDRPGVTKGKQWIRLSKDLELLDTPGILWPKFEDQLIGKNLAFTGSINDDIIQKEELCRELITYLSEYYPDAIPGKYDIDAESKDPGDVLYNVTVRLNALKKGGEPDTAKAANIILDDFRAGKLGKISLERPEDYGF